MITDSFDTSDVFISPEKLYPQSSETLDVCIGIFSHKVMNELITSGDLTELPMEKMPGSASGNMRYTVIKIQRSVFIKMKWVQSVPVDLLKKFQLSSV